MWYPSQQREKYRWSFWEKALYQPHCSKRSKGKINKGNSTLQLFGVLNDKVERRLRKSSKLKTCRRITPFRVVFESFPSLLRLSKMKKKTMCLQSRQSMLLILHRCLYLHINVQGKNPKVKKCQSLRCMHRAKASSYAHFSENKERIISYSPSSTLLAPPFIATAIRSTFHGF